MTGKGEPSAPDWDPDTAPDLSAPEWKARFDAAPVKRGRPRALSPKVSTTIRLDREVIEHFKAEGRGWQKRINEALRRAARLDRKGVA